MKRLVFAAIILLAAATAQAQTKTRISWDKDATGRATAYDVALTTGTWTGVAFSGPVAYAGSSPSTQTLTATRVYHDAPGIPKIGLVWHWYVRSRTPWGIVSPWSIPANQDTRAPNAPVNLKVEAKP